MSEAHNEHESAIKTPKQLITVVILAFLIPILGIMLLVQYVTSDKLTGAGSNSQEPGAVESRIQPVADEGFKLAGASGPKVLQSGEEVYKASCQACHGSGAAGAPKVGDAAAWSARIAKGYEGLMKTAIAGLNGMPAKGGNADLDDVEIGRAIVFMANQSGAKFKEPEAAAPAAAAAAGSASAAALSADAGKKVYDAACVACHGAGVAGAPKFGDKAAWTDRIKQGNPALYEHAIKGFQGKAGMMPAKGGSSASDDEIKAAVDYMTAAVK
ncbi:c-type cytochrome [Massilia sp. W12]|uniref:c-type cytochrome n=1 Tax=Massilia sp. W12 TaxID=3126507 RepID=UPI0030CCCC09